MIQVCDFDTNRDVGQVIEGLAPDINNMIENHIIPSTQGEVVYNELKEVSMVGSKVTDTFDALKISQGLGSIMSDTNNKKENE